MSFPDVAPEAKGHVEQVFQLLHDAEQPEVEARMITLLNVLTLRKQFSEANGIRSRAGFCQGERFELLPFGKS